MEEKVILTSNGQPEPNDTALPSDGGDTTPANDPPAEEKGFLEIKFNKELIWLDKESAATLAQKGMKYDLISADYDRLKGLSKEKGTDIDGLLAQLESKKTKDNSQSDFEKVKAEFPEISSYDMLPEEVITAANKNNTGLLYEYLLYGHRLRQAAKRETENQAFAAASTTGSLSADDRQDPTAAEFLKGVWGR